jgi:hypothetical protein
VEAEKKHSASGEKKTEKKIGDKHEERYGYDDWK